MDFAKEMEKIYALVDSDSCCNSAAGIENTDAEIDYAGNIRKITCSGFGGRTLATLKPDEEHNDISVSGNMHIYAHHSSIGAIEERIKGLAALAKDNGGGYVVRAYVGQENACLAVFDVISAEEKITAMMNRGRR